jgi:RNase P/RNase MRP subunit p29
VVTQLLLQLVVVLEDGIMSRDCLVVLAVAQHKVQQHVLPHQDMDIQAQLNKGIRVVLQGLDYGMAAVEAQDKQDKMDPLLLRERAETGHLFPGHLLRMVQLVQHQDDGLRVEVVQEVCQALVILQVAQVAQVAVAQVKDNLDLMDSQVMLILAAVVVAERVLPLPLHLVVVQVLL